MRFVKWTFWVLIALLVASFLHYTLPRHDIVRISDTYTRRVDFGDNRWFWAHAGTGDAVTQQNADIFFIQAIRENGRPMVYRNEDTGWGWPPYFKFDTTNLQTEAADLKSTSAEPQWARVTRYGWRIEMFSIFPNAVAVKPVIGPEARVIPWISIVILVVLAAVFWALRVRWLRFRRRRLDPMWDRAEERWDRGETRLARMFRRRD